MSTAYPEYRSQDNNVYMDDAGLQVVAPPPTATRRPTNTPLPTEPPTATSVPTDTPVPQIRRLPTARAAYGDHDRDARSH